MCFDKASNELLLAILGIAGTLLGALGGAYFAYLGIKKQFSQSIKKMRIDRTFVAYESLLEIIIAAQSKAFTVVGDKRHYISPIAINPEIFRGWYTQFQVLWHQKQYLLDDKSLNACKMIAERIARFSNKYPQFKAGILADRSSSVPVQVDPEEVLTFHQEFLVLLEAAHEPLKDFLKNRIEDM